MVDERVDEVGVVEGEERAPDDAADPFLNDLAGMDAGFGLLAF